MNELAERILYSKSGFTGVVDRIEECRRQCSRAGMILPWIRRRGSGWRGEQPRVSGAVCRGPVLAGLERCAPTATTRRYHE
jgi:hypothetical protein